MDDIYDNLENYNDVNIVDELKCENNELKMKLEEYSKAMAQLQKDFDNLNNEYKKLEKNYSSLLKTARAEIERKTETIKTLNTEKDMIIIKALQTTGKNILNATRNRSYSNERAKSAKKSVSTVVNDVKQNKEASVDSQERDNRINSNRTPSVDTSSTYTDNKSICSEGRMSRNVENIEKNKNKENSTKTLGRENSGNISRAKIMNRRKSVPVMSLSESKFSSDEETETIITNTRRSPPRVHMEPKHHERQDYITLDSYGYDTYNDPYRNRSSKFPSERRNDERIKYAPQQKPWRYHSPERYQQRYSKENSDNLRGDHRQRVLRSPPSDKYNRSKSRDRRFGSSQHNYSDYDKYSNQYHDNYAMKHKLRHEFDEPCNKRQKTDTYIKEINIPCVRHDLPPQEFIELSSCQSPDYIDNVGHHHIREIRQTAITKLDDPRTKSEKYIFSLCKNASQLVTVSGKMVDLKPVNLSAWGIEHYKTPEALLKPICEPVYNMDTDNNHLSQSLEFKESRSIPDNVTATCITQVQHSKKVIDKDIIPKKDENHENNSKIKKECNKKDVNTIRPDKSTKFKILKIKKPDKADDHKELDKPEPCIINNDDIKTKDVKKSSSSKDCNIISKSISKVKNVPNMPIIKNAERNESYTDNITIPNLLCNIKNDTQENFDLEKTNNERKIQEILSTIEGDLELSDETSDKESYKYGDKNKYAKHKTVTVDPTKVSSRENNTDIPFSSDKNTKSKSKIGSKESTSKNVAIKDSKENNKRRRSKRKISEQKDTNTKQDCEESVVINVKNNAKTNEQNVSKETQNKFKDLFGDSNSLITPDDLGLNTEVVQPATKYLPIFENTQDAVDLNIEHTSKVQNNMGVKNIESVTDKKQNDKINFSIDVTVVDGNSENNIHDKARLNLYENTKAKSIADSPTVVKTVIISSGTQAEGVLEKNTEQNSVRPDVPLIDTIVKKCALNSIKALATSTPQKLLENNGLIIKDNVCTSRNKTADVSLSSNVSSPNVTNTDAENEDVPDVRIFVRRRRKLIKKN